MGAGTSTTSFSYDWAGRRNCRILSNGATTTWAYDAADRMMGVKHRAWAGGTVLFTASMSYDAVNRRTQQVDYDPARADPDPYQGREGCRLRESSRPQRRPR